MPLPRSSRRLATSFATTGAVLIGACALAPLQVDRQARAPELTGYGTATLAIGTASPDAARRFAQGMAQAYAFNEAEAVREFKAALALDPACAMCAWGVAYQLGPNINDTDRGDLSEALRNVDHALRQSKGMPERDRALLEALALRYGHASTRREAAVLAAPVCGAKGGGEKGGAEKADPLDVAYAQRMRELADRFPDDPDVLTLYAEAEMIATRDDWWDPVTGAPAGRIGELADRLEAALVRHPEHTGLNHYLIHAVDALPVAARAQPAADRLGRLAPNSPHLLHMPSHTYVWLGRYADASRVNAEALAADETLAADLRAQGFGTSKDWRGHDGTFLWYAALMEGRGQLALDAARASAARAEGDGFYAEFTRSRPLLTLLRLERWDAVIAEPAAGGTKGVSSMLRHQARGVAFARTGRHADAAAALAQLEPEAARLIAGHPSTGHLDKLLRSLAASSLETLRAEVALADGRAAEALAHQASALVKGKDADDAEPPALGAGARLALGDMQLKAARWAEAEQSFRTDLAEHPKSGWALRGLERTLRAQGRAAEADRLHDELRLAWRAADAGLLAMR